MGMQINTNVSALNTYRNLTMTQNSLSKSLEKLSSGLRINSAADDAAGLVISEGLKSQVGGYTQAARNAQDGISVVQTAEGALGEAQSLLQRMRDLAVQAANDSNSATARTAITTEATSIQNELGRIATSTNFNGKALLDGSAASLTFQVGANATANDQISVTFANLNTTIQGLAAKNTSFAVASTAAVAGDYTFTNSTGASAKVSFGTASTTRTMNDVVSTLNSNSDFAANFTARNVVTAGVSALVVSAKAGDGTVTATASTTSTPVGAGIGAATNSTNTSIAFDSAANAQAAISAIDTAISAVSTTRSQFGALQNRFESAVNSINVAIENLSASKSRITDTDMAKEMVNYTRGQILAQAGVSMLAQANSQPQLALKLLG